MDCTVALAFNMMVAGKITGVPPRSYVDVMEGVMHIVPKAPRFKIPSVLINHASGLGDGRLTVELGHSHE